MLSLLLGFPCGNMEGQGGVLSMLLGFPQGNTKSMGEGGGALFAFSLPMYLAHGRALPAFRFPRRQMNGPGAPRT